jgi:hypothetical protein
MKDPGLEPGMQQRWFWLGFCCCPAVDSGPPLDDAFWTPWKMPTQDRVFAQKYN